MQKIYIGLIGLGTVGGSVARILQEHTDLIAKRAGVQICVKMAVVRDVAKYANFGIPVSANIEDVLEDEAISIVVELIGGIEYPFDLAKRVFAKNKALVSANKAMLAHHMRDLMECAKNAPIGFEASVCGGVPVIEVLRDSLVANHIVSFEGILNGTSNYILTQMFEQKMSFERALQEAQRLGYAESDPSLDVNGLDAGHKLVILAQLAYGIAVPMGDVLVEGIEGIVLEDLCFADEWGYRIKLLGIATLSNGTLDLRLHLALIPKDTYLAKIDGVTNALSVRGDCVGEVNLCGLGAGGDATASAVIADLVSIARCRNGAYPLPPFGFFESSDCATIKPKGEIESAYYLRFIVCNRSGVLAKITQILADCNISVNEILQKEKGGEVMIGLITYQTQEQHISKALCALAQLDFMQQAPYKIRIR
ncbi:hypothetical protein BBW65_04375 [Helicobacter enhydrae]|uniref:Homoserine dehydrogenase n=2 Tax=Helicobacter enhydrae TaxID=222136 RepID=A0A1B1U5S6_9HELI|nr:homoserine dehydrogenase [Helicobacter enhydrae]ANV98081.1 hypothetical protein BBW65_04375 [Helicobacter enhydrae]